MVVGWWGWGLCPSIHHRSHDQGGLCPGGGGGFCPGGVSVGGGISVQGVSVSETPCTITSGR